MSKFDARALNEKEASLYIGMSLGYLRQDRVNGPRGKRTPGPAFVKIGRTIRYLKEDLDTWLDTHRISQTVIDTDTFSV